MMWINWRDDNVKRQNAELEVEFTHKIRAELLNNETFIQLC